MTSSANDVPAVGHGYPRPQLRRTRWISLNGTWDFALDANGKWREPDEVHWTTSIQVPFAPEAPASGIGETGFFKSCWYRRRVPPPPYASDEHLLLHFGAVDYKASVWVNGTYAGAHEGGYTPFTLDVTRFVEPGDALEIIVRSDDDPLDLGKPRGKQDWQLEPHSIWYPRTSGIWQTVWLEPVPATRIGGLRWTPDVDKWEIGVDVAVEGPQMGVRLKVDLTVNGYLLASDTYLATGGEVRRRIGLSDPGIDDSRNELLWSPASPTLIHARLQLWGERGDLLDEVESYTGLRAVGTDGDRFVLNGRPHPLRLVLDQGYWPTGGMTPPDDESIYKDVALVKAMGFNGVRKHQKIEDPRYLYWADVLGVLVWEEMPSAYRFTSIAVERLVREWTAVIRRDASHPCIVAWVPINESWGVPSLPDNPAQRHYVRALYHLTKTLDPSRPVIGNDGWESIATDIIGIHDYDQDPAKLARRYHAHDVLPLLFKRERPGGRVLALEGEQHAEMPLVLTEFGGFAYSAEPATWGYARAQTPDEFALRYKQLLDVVRSLSTLCGFCYCQFADTYQECNGLLFADRTPKISIVDIHQATRGSAEQSGLSVSGPAAGEDF